MRHDGANRKKIAEMFRFLSRLYIFKLGTQIHTMVVGVNNTVIRM